MHPTVYVGDASEKRMRAERGGPSPPPPPPLVSPLDPFHAAHCRARPYGYSSLRPRPLESLSHSYTQTPLGGLGTRGEYRIMTPEGSRKKRRTRRTVRHAQETRETKVRYGEKDNEERRKAMSCSKNEGFLFHDLV